MEKKSSDRWNFFAQTQCFKDSEKESDYSFGAEIQRREWKELDDIKKVEQ